MPQNICEGCDEPIHGFLFMGKYHNLSCSRRAFRKMQSDFVGSWDGWGENDEVSNHKVRCPSCSHVINVRV